jgi:elongation factor Ts
VEGRVNGFFKDNCLLEQSSVIDNKKSVKQVLEEAGTSITSFTRIEIAG